MAILTYGGLELSLSRALKKAPRQFAPAYQWFVDHQNAVGPRPYGNHAPEGLEIKLAAERGIHKPGGFQYVISITSTLNNTYSSDHLHHLNDDTWVLQYCAHRQNSGKTAGSPEYNRALVRCLEHGLPVGVFIKEGTVGYRCLGLAFVERFNSQTDMFWLHGPVGSAGPDDGLSPVSKHDREQLTEEWNDGQTPQNWFDEITAEGSGLDDEDDRERKMAHVVRRKQQGIFRKNLLDAYQGRCAISQFDAEPSLQAAHICSYLGQKSQFVSNGLLLRADLHLLFDQQLIGIDPDTCKIHVGAPIRSTKYAELDGRSLCLPKKEEQRPSPIRLAAQFSDFLRAEADFKSRSL